LQDILTKLQWEQDCKPNDDLQRAYYYVRAWATSQGLFNTLNFNTEGILKLLMLAVRNDTENLSSILCSFFNSLRTSAKVDSFTLSSNTLDDESDESVWNKRLIYVEEEEQFYDKFKFPYYVQISVGCQGSKIKGCVWLSMVKRKLAKLEKCRPNPFVLFAEPPIPIISII
jgi:hypothetical protein